ENEQSPFTTDFVVRGPRGLNYDRMREALEVLKGSHDFINYMCVGTPVKSSIREIFDCGLRISSQFEFQGMVLSPVHELYFHGSGFLKQMVRLLVGALWNVGLERVSVENFSDSLKVPI